MFRQSDFIVFFPRRELLFCFRVGPVCLLTKVAQPMELKYSQLLTRKEASRCLTERGYKVAPSTLAKKASIGGGPPYVSFGRRALYREADLLSWAEERTTGLRRSTSDAGTKESAPGQPAAL